MARAPCGLRHAQPKLLHQLRPEQLRSLYWMVQQDHADHFFKDLAMLPRRIKKNDGLMVVY